MSFIKIAPIVLILTLGFFGYFLYSNKENLCTLSDAKICPDGTKVVRTGPDCEYQACPAIDQTSTVNETPNPSRDNNLKTLCEGKGGVWSEQYKECTGIKEEECANIGGEFNGSAYPCRHDPDAKFCITMCVKICVFTSADAHGKMCGGIAGIFCPQGYKCQLDGNYPDAGGKCVKE